jgi:hypothetical protein
MPDTLSSSTKNQVLYSYTILHFLQHWRPFQNGTLIVFPEIYQGHQIGDKMTTC